MALTSTGCYPASDSHGRQIAPPFLASSGRIYVVGMAGNNSNTIQVRRTGTSDTTFANSLSWSPDGTTVHAYDVFQRGDILDIVAVVDSSGAPVIYYRELTLAASDSWGTAQSFTPSVTNNPLYHKALIAAQADGDLIVVYHGDSNKVKGTNYQRAFFQYSQNGGSTWSGGTGTAILDPGSVEDSISLGTQLAITSGDRVHVFGSRSDGNLIHQSIESGLTTGTNQVAATDCETWSSTTALWEDVGEAVVYMDGATEKVAVVFREEDRDTGEVFATTGSAPSWTAQTVTTWDNYWGGTYTGSLSNLFGASLAYSSTTTEEAEEITCLLPEHTSGDYYIQWRDADNSSSWGSTFLDESDVDSRRVRSRAMQRGGSNIVAYTCWSGGAVFTDIEYKEVFLNTIPTTQSDVPPNRNQATLRRL